MSPKDDEQPLLSSLEQPARRKRGRKPGQKSTKASELSDQELVQKVLRLGKRAGRSPEEMVELMAAYLDRFQQILDLRRQADEMERQLLIGEELNGSQGPTSGSDPTTDEDGYGSDEDEESGDEDEDGDA